MKKLLLLSALLVCAFSQSQTLTEIYSEYIQPQSTTQELREGIEKIDQLCSTNPQEKCNKAKASALYLLADDYYQAAYKVYSVDQELATPILEKAKQLYAKANSIMAIDAFPESQQRLMLESKLLFESSLSQ